MKLRFPSFGNYVLWLMIGAMAGLIAGVLGVVTDGFTPPDAWYRIWVDWPGGVYAGVIVWDLLVVALPSTGLAGFLAGWLSRPVGRDFYLAACLAVALGMLLSIYFLVIPFLDFSMSRYRLLWWEYLPEAVLFAGVWLGRGLPVNLRSSRTA